MATQTSTLTSLSSHPEPQDLSHRRSSVQHQSNTSDLTPESTELFSLKQPGKSLKELSSRITHIATKRPKTTTDELHPSLDVNEDAESLRNAGVPAPIVTQLAAQRWNHPRINIYRLASMFFSFAVAGLNDAAIGALIPYLERYYSLSYTVISLIFLTPFFGYSVAAFVNATVHSKFGQRGIGIIAPICHIITFAVLSAHPPFPVIVVVLAIAGFGTGLCDAAFCAYAGNMANANAVQGILHSCYSIGATLSPLIATSMIVRAKLPWYSWYYVMTGASFIELITLSTSFWGQTGHKYRLDHPRTPNSKDGRTKEALKSKITWLCAVFFFIYMGVEVGVAGWITTFMLRERNASNYASGLAATGFWAGMAAGRMGLGFVTERFGERLCVSVYLGLCIALQLIFWLVPQFVVSAVAIAFLGFFVGPMFPGGVIMATKLLPSHLHVSSIGFATAIGGTGGSIFPFAIGAIAAAKGVGVLQPIVLALLVALGIVWISFPRIKKRE